MTGKRALVYLIIIAGIVVSLLGLGGCISTVIGSPNTSTREMNFRDFSRLEIGGTFEVTISRADSYKVSITANDNLFDYIDVSRRGDTLIVVLKPRTNYLGTTQKATITMPDLYQVAFSGVTKGKVSGFKFSHPFEVHLSGFSSLSLDDIEFSDARFTLSGASQATGSIKTANCRFELSGASFVELEGSGADMTIEGSGASRLKLAEFQVVNDSVNLSGASSATVFATGRLDGNLSGGSRLTYLGNPTLGQLTTSGGSTIGREQ